MPIVGRPTSMAMPTLSGPTRPVTSLVFDSSVPRPWMPVALWVDAGSLKNLRIARGYS